MHISQTAAYCPAIWCFCPPAYAGYRPGEKGRLETNEKGAILVNDELRTSAEDIYAVGDAVQVNHFVTGQKALIALAGPANKQGRIAADNICGGDSRYTGSQGSSVIKVFGLTAAVTGISETAARQAGIPADQVVLSPMSHAGYYRRPGDDHEGDI